MLKAFSFFTFELEAKLLPHLSSSPYLQPTCAPGGEAENNFVCVWVCVCVYF